ncbi:hypothetical protein L249_4892 [Ophiocordyceps polyrhachis-furcata BCC 54312]|uniref:Uncharacterized protein n=1 Tax=Ophiocordyceps polyrhachis-furcata BCC 54312 TaxID=1330021 RepID=A0A367L2Z7_9HYPO|nr:hypothetical protein L249_4892 [Ophiocordyceps polyrhachis-furcata BCC 54312]
MVRKHDRPQRFPACRDSTQDETANTTTTTTTTTTTMKNQARTVRSGDCRTGPGTHRLPGPASTVPGGTIQYNRTTLAFSLFVSAQLRSALCKHMPSPNTTA